MCWGEPAELQGGVLSNRENPFLLFKRKSLDADDHRLDLQIFEDWIERLTVGDPEHAARDLYKRLSLMNGVEISVADRLQNMEVCAPAIVSVLGILGHKVTERNYPLSRQMQTTIRLISEVYSLTAKGYKTVLNQYSSDSVTGYLLHKQNRVLALHRLIYLLGRVQLLAYQHYQPVPKYLWSELHSMYFYGLRKQLVDTEVRGIDSQLSNACTATDIYKQTLLLSLAGPYRLFQGEVCQVYRALIHRGGSCILPKLDPNSGVEAAFIVDYTRDEGPRYRNADQDAGVSKGCLLNTRELAVNLACELDRRNVELGAVRPHGTDSDFPTELLAKMMLAWGVGLKRVSSRTDRLGKMVMVDGLERVYELLGGAPIPTNRGWCAAEGVMEEDVFASEHLPEDQHWVDGGPDLSRLKRWDNEKDPSGQMVVDEEIKESLDQIGEDEPEAPETSPELNASGNSEAIYIVLDESDSGYHLSTAGSHVGMIKVGELVGLQNVGAGGGEETRIGVIRWLKMQKPSLLDFGVELLDGEWAPVVYGQQSKRGGREYYRALLHNQSGQDGLLITEPFYAEGFDEGFILTEASELNVHLNRVLEVTASFLQFQISGDVLDSGGMTTDTESRKETS